MTQSDSYLARIGTLALLVVRVVRIVRIGAVGWRGHAGICLLLIDMPYVVRVSGLPLKHWLRYLFPAKRRIRFGAVRLAA